MECQEKKQYIEPTFEKRNQLTEVTEGIMVVTGLKE